MPHTTTEQIQAFELWRESLTHCPRCQDQITTGFYCLRCGFVPEWRTAEQEERSAA